MHLQNEKHNLMVRKIYAMKGLQMAKQIEFDTKLLAKKRFNMENLIHAKFNKLACSLDRLTHADVVWLSKVEDFFIKNEYVTERQIEVLDSIIKRHVCN